MPMMDFMKWLSALGDALYEVIAWLVFYPVTLGRTILRPLGMMRYADQELQKGAEKQFADALSPPLLLLLSLLLTQIIDVALGGGVNPLIASKAGLATFIHDDSTLLVLRLVLFSLFPLMAATRSLRARDIRLTRQLLRGPFYAQCYACASFSLFLGIGVSLSHTGMRGAFPIGVLISAGALLAYLTIQTLWFSHQLRCGWLNGLINAVRAFVEAGIMFLGFAFLFVSH